MQECRKLNIPIVALLDTNCDPDLVDVPIPANDDAMRSVKLILSKLADAINEGRRGATDTEEPEYEEFSSELEGEETTATPEDFGFTDEDT